MIEQTHQTPLNLHTFYELRNQICDYEAHARLTERLQVENYVYPVISVNKKATKNFDNWSDRLASVIRRICSTKCLLFSRSVATDAYLIGDDSASRLVSPRGCWVTVANWAKSRLPARGQTVCEWCACSTRTTCKTNHNLFLILATTLFARISSMRSLRAMESI